MFKILLLAVVAVGFVQAGDKSMKAFKDAKIAKDLNIWLPPKEMKVEFAASNVKAKYGNQLEVCDVDHYPITEWQFPEEDESAYFTLVAIDVDDNTCDGTGKLLWLINNICINNPSGDQVLSYEAPVIAGNRIAFFVYYQSGAISTESNIVRENFNLATYAKKNACSIWSGNFFYTK